MDRTTPFGTDVPLFAVTAPLGGPRCLGTCGPLAAASAGRLRDGADGRADGGP